MAITPLQTFLFADLAGFTALTEVHGDEQAADLVERFGAQARQALPSFAADEVKSIGDALLLHSDDAAQAVRLAHHLAGDIGGNHGFPGVRVGMHTGPAVERGDDWFGATVNLASRVAGAATAGEVLVTEATKEAAEPGLPGCDFRFVGAKRFKNVKEPVRVYAAVTPRSPMRAGPEHDGSGVPDGGGPGPLRLAARAPRRHLLLLFGSMRDRLRRRSRALPPSALVAGPSTCFRGGT